MVKSQCGGKGNTHRSDRQLLEGFRGLGEVWGVAACEDEGEGEGDGGGEGEGIRGTTLARDSVHC